MDRIRNVEGMEATREKTRHGIFIFKYTIFTCYLPIEDAKEAREWKTATEKYTEPGQGRETMAKRDKKEEIENPAEKAEEAEAGRDLQTLYIVGKMLRGVYSSGNVPIKDEDGTVLSRVEDPLRRC